jgi:hypothetical protein
MMRSMTAEVRQSATTTQGLSVLSRLQSPEPVAAFCAKLPPAGLLHRCEKPVVSDFSKFFPIPSKKLKSPANSPGGHFEF